MEVVEELKNGNSTARKHSTSESEKEVHNNGIPKKVRLFSAKEFRKNVRNDNRMAALKQFLYAINDSNGHDYVFEYLENGGNCLELLQTLELDSTISPVLVFELVAQVLLKVTATGPQYHSAAFESCRYMLNNYITVINKMLNLSSTTPERKVCLKLLTAMITFSSTLAKDILLHVNFHSANIEVLTKNTGEEGSVRDHFIHFLTAFLIDGHYPSLSVLLEKKGFITSIIKGLQFDVADTVCIVISAMKNHILENPLVSKTAKMKIFNTLVVRDIVNLYNWKGPAALKTHGKNKPISVKVDEYSKSKVSECIHDFLLVLCTSHKNGVIFRDHSLGSGKKHQNALMYTVIESLERPWDHSYASELVTKICVACPDLTKTMWVNLKTSLEPRMTEKWLNALKFAKNLLRELHPSCIEFCAAELNVSQLAQALQILAAPLPILKTVTGENQTFESPMIKRHVMTLILEMLRSLNSYLEASKRWLNVENQEKLKTLMSNYVTKNFPNANSILNDWEGQNGDNSKESTNISNEIFLETVFDIFELYSRMVPQLLDSLNAANFQLVDFLCKLSNTCEDKEFSARLQVKMINIFIDLEPTNFSVHTELFSFVLPILLEFYYRTIDHNALSVLFKLLKYTGIFEGCVHEINIWINGILNLHRFDNSVVENLVQILRMSAQNFMEFSEELSDLKVEHDTDENFTKLIEKLKNTDLTFEDESVVVKHKYFSPVVLGLAKYLQNTKLTKSLKYYVNFVMVNLFHCQTDMEMLKEFVRKYEAIPKNIKDYILSWTASGEIAYLKHKGKIQVFETVSEDIFFETFENYLKNLDINTYSDLPLNLLQAGIFYITNILNNQIATEYIFQNCSKFINHLIQLKLFHDSYMETVLVHPVLLHHLSFVDLENVCTKLLLNVIKLFVDSGFDLSRFLKIYREKLLKAVIKVLRKPKKYDIPNFINVIQLFDLSYEQCVKILTVSTESKSDGHYTVVLDLLSYTLKRLAFLYADEDNAEPLEGSVIAHLTAYFVSLNEQDVNVTLLSEAFHKYFEMFPHHIAYVNPNLLKSLANLTEYNKENVALMTFLLERNIRLFDGIKDNLEGLCNKKAVLLPILDIIVEKAVDEDVLKQIFQLMETSVSKALLKPQKAGQHIHVSYKGLRALIEKFMPLEKCRNFTDKIQKFEVTEIFHVKCLETIIAKVIEDNVSVKQVNNIILTFVHLQMQILKRKTNENVAQSKTDEVAQSFNNLLLKIRVKCDSMDLKSTSENETLKSYIVHCLKFGISGHPILLRALTNLIEVLSGSMAKIDGKLVLDMLLSHSQFLDVVLEEDSPVKLEIFKLFLTLCRTFPDFKERFHIPMILASYRSMINPSDVVIWELFRLYSGSPDQTHFYDFKPFLWGRAAASQYSVRQDTEKNLWRQPKMRDVLDILQEEYVLSTIVNYPLKNEFSEDEVTDLKNKKCYDIRYLLPNFNQLLAPEQQVQTYAFTRSGALGLTVVALSSEDQRIRSAACAVLKGFHGHVDASQHGKDNPLWLRYVEAVCKGLAQLPGKKLNNFSAIYLAKMSLILTQPNHVMYVPLSQHLTAKPLLDFSTVPELYTFLHSSDVNYKEHRRFILELLRDGLRTEQDFRDFSRSMAFKLFSELYNSSLADLDTKLLILDVILAACKIPLGVRKLCENHSLLPQLYQVATNILMLPLKEKQEAQPCISKVLFVLLNIGKTLQDTHSLFMIFNIVMKIIRHDVFSFLTDNDLRTIFELLHLVNGQLPELFTNEVVNVLLDKSGDKFCKYVVKYGCDFIDVNSLCATDVYYHLKLLIVIKMKA